MDLLSAFRSKRPVSQARSPRSRWRPTIEALELRLTPSTVTIDALAGRHAIDPNIYGVAFATTAQLADLNVPINRSGGNTTSTYNWQQDASNHANDWYFESIADGPGTPGKSMDDFVNATKAGGAQASLTIPMLDYVAKLGPNRSKLASYSIAKYGPQTGNDWQWFADAGNGVRSDGSLITNNDPNDANTPNSVSLQQGWVQHLISTFGNASGGGVKYYTMDNEPGLWNSTHRDVHPNGDTLPELRDKILAYAAMVKALDPNAKILGPEEWGWTNYFISGQDAAASNWSARYTGTNATHSGTGLDAEAWLLDQLRQHDAATGTRLLDYFTLHYYPQGGEFSNDVSTAMQLLRNQSTRSLWDPSYVDQSWIGTQVQLIPRMKAWVNTYYPGTKIGITEYNWGAEDHMNGGTTQADIFGIFGREGLDLANRWTTPATGSEAYKAIQMYRNYDGNKSTFGDTSVSASESASPDNVSVFASIRSSDGALTIMVVNKQLSAADNLTINLSNFAAGGVAQRWQLAGVGGDPTNGAISHIADVSFAGNSFTATVPNQSVTLFVLAPATTGTAPSITTQPANQTVTAGQTATFSVTATGTGSLTYQWQRSNDGGTTWANVSGATGSSYTTAATVAGDNNARFRVNVSNASGTTTSSSALLTVNFAPAITAQPAGQTVNVGQTATFSVTATGNPAPTFQWQRSNDGGTTWANISGATSASYTTAATVAGDNNARFRAVVSNAAGSVTSAAATLTVTQAPVITTQPANQTVNASQTATFSVTATGTGLTYQWQRSNDGGTTWANISGATAASYSFAAMASDNNARFRAIVSNAAGSATSSAATLTVIQAPVITSQPANRAVKAGQTATFSVTATGIGLSYQWQRSNDGGSTWINVSGATASSYTTAATVASDNNARFRVVVSNAAGSVTSAAATLTVRHHR